MPRRALASAVLALLAAGALPMSKAYACSCAGPPEGGYPIEGTVFSGEVVSRAERDRLVTYVVAVDRVYSGDVGARAEVRTSADGASCGIDIPSGVPAVFFTDRDEDGTLSVSACSGSGPGTPPASFPEGRAVSSASPVSHAEPADSGRDVLPLALAIVGVVAAGALVTWRVRLRQ